MSIELKEFVREALIAKGLNGLQNFDGEGCACLVDDLMPCDQPNPDCVACVLIRVKANECKDEGCEWQDDDHLHEVKP